jgi:hypothetical protein
MAIVETAHLHRDELGGRLGHAASENVSNERAHVLLATPSRSAGSVTETPRFKNSTIRLSRFAFAWRSARRASTDRSRRTASGADSTICDIQPSPSCRRENKERTISETSQ